MASATCTFFGDVNIAHMGALRLYVQFATGWNSTVSSSSLLATLPACFLEKRSAVVVTEIPSMIVAAWFTASVMIGMFNTPLKPITRRTTFPSASKLTAEWFFSPKSKHQSALSTHMVLTGFAARLAVFPFTPSDKMDAPTVSVTRDAWQLQLRPVLQGILLPWLLCLLPLHQHLAFSIFLQTSPGLARTSPRARLRGPRPHCMRPTSPNVVQAPVSRYPAIPHQILIFFLVHLLFQVHSPPCNHAASTNL